MSENEIKATSADVKKIDSDDVIMYQTDVIINGSMYFQSLAHQLAKHICCRQYDEFRLSCKFGFMDATIYMERLLRPASPFLGAKWDEKKCIGVLYFDIETYQITLQKTAVKTEIHEFHADEKRGMDDCFGVQYEIFKHLRDGDLIRIIATERKVRHKEVFVYTITKMKALKSGRFLHFNGYGTQFFIPKSEFKCVSKGQVKEKKNTNKKQTTSKSKKGGK